MKDKILGIHHITAIAGDAQRNYDFYTKVLGLRLVKKTVNFDDPQTYHFYFGDETGNPGTILTFFPWTHVKQGKTGAGMVTEINYAVPSGSLSYWTDRMKIFKVRHDTIVERFGEKLLSFRDPDGLHLTFTEPAETDNRYGWPNADIDAGATIKGFHSAVITLNNIKETAEILTDLFGYKFIVQEKQLHRYKNINVEHAAFIDLLEAPDAQQGINAGGTNHHIAFRVKDEETLMAFREKILRRGLYITEKINRDYFFSLYFREPGGVLFEIATDNPGFATDETLETLGTALQLPDRYKPIRDQIEKALPEIQM